jgi:hypothetical protein
VEIVLFHDLAIGILRPKLKDVMCLCVWWEGGDLLSGPLDMLIHSCPVVSAILIRCQSVDGCME